MNPSDDPRVRGAWEAVSLAVATYHRAVQEAVNSPALDLFSAPIASAQVVPGGDTDSVTLIVTVPRGKAPSPRQLVEGCAVTVQLVDRPRRDPVPAPDYQATCRKGPHLTVAHRGRTDCICPCHLGNEGRAWWTASS